MTAEANDILNWLPNISESLLLKQVEHQCICPEWEKRSVEMASSSMELTLVDSTSNYLIRLEGSDQLCEWCFVTVLNGNRDFETGFGQISLSILVKVSCSQSLSLLFGNVLSLSVTVSHSQSWSLGLKFSVPISTPRLWSLFLGRSFSSLVLVSRSQSHSLVRSHDR